MMFDAKVFAVLGSTVGIARVPKDEIDHEGEAYLILYRLCHVREFKGSGGFVVYGVEDRRDTPLKDTGEHDWSEILCSIR
jgi:hypothetical protein